MRRLEEWWKTWDRIHDRKELNARLDRRDADWVENGFHAGAFQRSSLKYMLNYARVYVLCATIARIQKRPSSEVLPDPESDAVLGLWKSLVEIIMGQMALLVNETAYRCQLTWSPTYPALTIAFISRFPLLCPLAGTNLASNIRCASGTVASGFDRSKLGLATSAANE
jgi:hypothetical protein